MKDEREGDDERREKEKEREEKEKHSVLTYTRGGMYMSVSLFCSCPTRKRSLEHVRSMIGGVPSL